MAKHPAILLGLVLAAASGSPALAGYELSGYYKTVGFVSNGKNYTSFIQVGKDLRTNTYIEQRIRLKNTVGTENVKAVAFFEIDSVWGDKNGSSAKRGSGAALGADATNIETKNVYVWFKVPDTAVDFTVGLQNRTDSYAGVFFGISDMAGIFMNAEIEPVRFLLGYSEWYRDLNNNTAGGTVALNRPDGMALWLAEAKFSPSKNARAGVNLYYLDDSSQRDAAPRFLRKVWMPGVDGTFKAGPATINAFFFYQFGDYKKFIDPAPGVSDVRISAYAFDARADLAAGPGSGFVEFLYTSGGDDPNDKYKAIITANEVPGSVSQSYYARTDMQILLLNYDGIGTAAALAQAMGNGGRGTWAVTAGYAVPVEKWRFKAGLGYLSATKLLKSDDGVKDGKGMGTEVNAKVEYAIMKGLDAGLTGAYAWLGKFFKTPGDSSRDPDNVFDLHASLRYSF